MATGADEISPLLEFEGCWSNFDYAAAFTENMLVGNVALRLQKELVWDGPNMKVTNFDEANQFVKRQYRQGWSLGV